MRRSLVLAATLVGSVLTSSMAHAGPWVPGLNHGYVKTSLRWLPAFLWNPGPEHADASTAESRVLYGPYNEVFAGTYWEHGIAPRTAMWVSWEPVRLYILSDPRTDETRVHPSVGEPTVGLKGTLIKKGPMALGLEVGLTIPLIDNRVVDDVYSLADGNPRIAELRTGTGVWDVAPAFSVGAGFAKMYVTGGVGVKIRSGGWDTVVLWNAEVGRKMGPRQKGNLRLKLGGHHPVGNGTTPYHDSVSGLGNGTHYTGFTVEFDRQVSDHWFVGLSLAGGMALVIRQTGGPVVAFNVSAIY